MVETSLVKTPFQLNFQTETGKDLQKNLSQFKGSRKWYDEWSKEKSLSEGDEFKNFEQETKEVSDDSKDVDFLLLHPSSHRILYDSSNSGDFSSGSMFSNHSDFNSKYYWYSFWRNNNFVNMGFNSDFSDISGKSWREDQFFMKLLGREQFDRLLMDQQKEEDVDFQSEKKEEKQPDIRSKSIGLEQKIQQKQKIFNPAATEEEGGDLGRDEIFNKSFDWQSQGIQNVREQMK